MDDLARWLGEQLDEDERIARGATEFASPQWHLDEDSTTVLMWPPEPRVAEMERRKGLPVTSDEWRGVMVDSSGNAGLGQHVARHDPARVLREIESKRQMLRDADDFCAEYDNDIDDDNSAAQRAYCWRDTIRRNLAVAYADRPGYLEEWRP